MFKKREKVTKVGKIITILGVSMVLVACGSDGEKASKDGGLLYSNEGDYLTVEPLTSHFFAHEDDFKVAMDQVKAGTYENMQVNNKDGVDYIAVGIPHKEGLSDENMDRFIYVQNYMLELSEEIGFVRTYHENASEGEVCALYNEETKQYEACTIGSQMQHTKWMLDMAKEGLDEETYNKFSELLMKAESGKQFSLEDAEALANMPTDFLVIKH